jgi:4-amino-4-deoxychorismate lyase
VSEAKVATAPTVLVDGQPADNVAVSDRGLQFGDGLFETLAVFDGRPTLWDAHMRRLERGCVRLGLPLPDPALLAEDADRVCTGGVDGVLKILWTAGPSERGYRRPPVLQPTRIVRYTPRASRGDLSAWRLVLCTHRWSDNPVLAGIKHLNRLDQVLARAEVDRAGADEGVMLAADGRVVSGTMTNLVLQHGRQLTTPRITTAGIAGVVRGLLLETADRLGADARESDIVIDSVHDADAVFACNSLVGVVRIAEMDGRAYDPDIAEHPVVTATREACARWPRGVEQ